MSEDTPTPAEGLRSERYAIALVGIVAASFTPAVAWGPFALLATAFFIAAGVLTLNRQYSTVGLLIFTVLAAGFILPAINAARPAALRIACSANMWGLAEAVRAYESQYGELPPPYTTDALGNRLHSWRVLVLPFLGEQQLYDAIDLDKPWYDPANLALANRMPPIFRCPEHRLAEGEPPTTSYVAVVGDRTLWPRGGGRGWSDITDDPVATLLLMEWKSDHVHWMSPADPEYETLAPVDSLGQRMFAASPHYGGGHAAMAEGRTFFLSDHQTFEDFKSFLLIDDGGPTSD